MERHIFTNSKEVNDFRQWALRLGSPLRALPNDLTLNRCMKSCDKNSLLKMMNMAGPRNEVKPIRDNMLLASVSTFSVTQAKSSSRTLSNIKNHEKVQKRIKDVLPRVEQCKAAAMSKQEVIYDKGIQVLKMRKARRDNQGKFIQFKVKHSDLMEKLKKENEFEAFIQKSTPVGSIKSESDTNYANTAIQKAVTLLKRAYEAIGDRPLTNNLKVKLEEELKKITANIPPFVLLESMKSYNNQQMKLTEKCLHNIQPFVATNYRSMSSFQISITKTKAKILLENLKVIQLKVEEQRDIERYTALYEQVYNNMFQQMRIYNSCDSELDSESICGEYLKEFTTLHSNEVLFEYFEKLIIHWQTIVSDRDEQLKRSEAVISELCDLYGKIEKRYHEIMDDVSALGVVNKKLKYLQELSTYTLNSARNWNTRNSSKVVFNNTKSVLDCSTIRLPATTATMNPTPAKYLNEILMLSDIPTDKWNGCLPVNVSMEIAGQLPNIMISPLFSFLTPNASLKESKLECAWHRLISNFSAAVKFGVVADINFEIVSANVMRETERMSDLVEQIKLRYELSNMSMISAQKYLNFLLNTSIGHFIPPRMKINGRSYQDYEHEFLLMCSLIKKSFKN